MSFHGHLQFSQAATSFFKSEGTGSSRGFGTKRQEGSTPQVQSQRRTDFQQP
jgi:hypothetical protein